VELFTFTVFKLSFHNLEKIKLFSTGITQVSKEKELLLARLLE
jgi:hypothetical protein